MLVSQNRLARRAPVHSGTLAVCESPLEHPDEDQLLPPIVLGIARGDLTIPVVRDAHLPQLIPHVADIFHRPLCRVDAAFDRSVLRRKPKSVPSHRMEHVVTSHPFKAGEHVADRIHAHVAHVDAPRRIRKHFKDVVLGLADILRDPEGFILLPDSLPLLFYGFGLIPFFHGLVEIRL